MYIGRCWGYLGVQVLVVCLSNDIPNSEAFFPCIHLPLGGNMIKWLMIYLSEYASHMSLFLHLLLIS